MAFDFDGTLVPDGNPVLPANLVPALVRLRRLGVKLAAITGRDRLPPQARAALPLDAVASHNGSEVQVGQEVVAALHFTDEELDIILAHEMKEARTMLFSGGKLYTDPTGGTRKPAREYFPTAEAPRGRVQKVNFFHAEVAQHAQQLRAALPHATLTGAQPPYESMLTVTPAGGHKGAGLGILAEALGIPLTQTVVFGDSDNDIAMFEVAGYAVQSGDLPLLANFASESISGPESLGEWLQAYADKVERA